MAFPRIILRNLGRHKLRSLLTIGSLVVAIFLLITLRSLVVALSAGAEVASTKRLWVQSAVSLFVDMPLSYTEKIERVPGVETACKWQWFGGYYQDTDSFFGQFAVDGAEMLDMYPEVDIVEGSREAFLQNRIGAMVGKGLVDQFDWKLGDRIPIIGALFPNPAGTDVAWEFEIEAIYEPNAPNFDDRTFFFNWDYFEKTLEGGEAPLAVGAIVLRVADGADPTRVMAQVDALFENGPQRVQTTTEAEFQAQFVSMFGNIPFFVSSIGGGVLIAILLACVNTMLMAAREQTIDIGIMKALGFTDGSMFGLLISQAFVLCGLGGALGILLALGMEPKMAKGLGQFFPGYRVSPSTIVFGVLVTVLIGLVAGIVPAWRASRLRCVEALGERE